MNTDITGEKAMAELLSVDKSGKCKDDLQMEFYIQMTKRYGWTKRVLTNFVEAQTYEKYLLNIESSKCMEIMIGETKAVIAAIPLKECIKIPGIKDGSLFRKNVRQPLGTSNKVNKGIA